MFESLEHLTQNFLVTQPLQGEMCKPEHYLIRHTLSDSKHRIKLFENKLEGGGPVVRWGWVNFQCRGILQFGLQ